jgi:hypothetical protein
VKWINIATGQWAKGEKIEQAIEGGSAVNIKAPTMGDWVAAIVRAP